MVARRCVVHHKGTEFPINYDTENGFEFSSFRFSLTSVPPDDQKLTAGERDLVVTEESDLVVISEGLRLASIEDGAEEKWNRYNNWGNPTRKWRMLQAEEEALFFQQFQANEDAKEFEQRVRPYIDRVMLYEDPVLQEAARETVPISEIQEKDLVSLAKLG